MNIENIPLKDALVDILFIRDINRRDIVENLHDILLKEYNINLINFLKESFKKDFEEWEDYIIVLENGKIYKGTDLSYMRGDGIVPEHIEISIGEDSLPISRMTAYIHSNEYFIHNGKKHYHYGKKIKF